MTEKHTNRFWQLSKDVTPTKIKHTITNKLKFIIKFIKTIHMPTKLKTIHMPIRLPKLSKTKLLRILKSLNPFYRITSFILFTRHKCQCCHKKIPYKTTYFIALNGYSRLCEYCHSTCFQQVKDGVLVHVKTEK
jgi:hypothetical protein